MIRQTKHDRTRTLWPEPDKMTVTDLIGWLNGRSGDGVHSPLRDDRQRAKVLKVIGLLQRFDSLRSQLHQGQPDFEQVSRNLNQVWSDLNGVLEKYKGIRQISCFADCVHSCWWPAGHRNYSLFMDINIALDLFDRGDISRLRQCGCGKYFLARSSLGRFHSADCRVEFWESSEERKQRKRKQAREYYLLHKAGIVKRSGAFGRKKGAKDGQRI